MGSLDDIRNHVRRIERQVKDTIAVLEAANLPLFDIEIIDAFRNTYAAHTLEVIRYRLYQSAVVLALAAWENDLATNSIPALIKKLEKKGLVSQLAKIRATEVREIHRTQISSEGKLSAREVTRIVQRMARIEAQKTEARTLEGYDLIVAIAGDVDAKARRESLAIERNRFAHMIEKTRAEITAEKKGKKSQKQSGMTLAWWSNIQQN